MKKIEIKDHFKPWKKFKLLKTALLQSNIAHLSNQHLGRFGLFLKVPFVITVHDTARLQFRFVRESFKERICLCLDKRGIEKANIVIAVSEYTKRML